MDRKAAGAPVPDGVERGCRLRGVGLLLLVLNLLLLLVPARDSGRGRAQKLVALGCRQKSGRRCTCLLLPSRNHLARARAEHAIVAARVEAERGQRDLQALTFRLFEAQDRARPPRPLP